MTGRTKYDRIISVGIRMVARFLGSMLFLMIAMFAVGEGLPNPLALSVKEAVIFGSFIIMLGGLIAAWKWEGTGGLIILAGYLIFALINPDSFSPGIITIFPLTGLLFIFSWLRWRRISSHS